MLYPVTNEDVEWNHGDYQQLLGISDFRRVTLQLLIQNKCYGI